MQGGRCACQDAHVDRNRRMAFTVCGAITVENLQNLRFFHAIARHGALGFPSRIAESGRALCAAHVRHENHVTYIDDTEDRFAEPSGRRHGVASTCPRD